jgi:hypothetical protein
MNPEIEKLRRLQETELQIRHYIERIDLLPKQLADLEAKLSGTLKVLESIKQEAAKDASEKPT